MPQQRRNNTRDRNLKVSPTVKDFRDVLGAARHIVAVRARRDDALVLAIREIEAVLTKYSSQPASEIGVAIRRHFETVADLSVRSAETTVEAVSASTPLETIKQWIADPETGRERLITIARGRFMMPPGRLAKLSKPGIREEIEAAIRSMEGSDIVGRVASDDRRQN